MKYQASRILSAIFVLLLGLSVSISQAQSPQQTLNQYVSDLQKNPNDYALREKIIRHVQTIKPAPAVPEEARRQYVMGKTLFEDAKTVQDFKDAIEKFRKALLIAPWWPEANRDLGMALQAAQEYGEAIRALKLYIATNPGEELSRRAQNEIYKIEAKQEKATKESSRQAQAAAAPQQNPFEDLLRKIHGRRYFYPIPGQNGYAKTLDVSGRYLLLGLIVPPGHANRNDSGGYISYANRADGRYEIRGRETTVKIPYTDIPPMKEWAVEMTYIISENGDRITERSLFNTGKVGNELIYVWRQGLSQ